MNIKRVLVIHSIRDMIYGRRLHVIETNSYLSQFTFEHCCVIDFDRRSEWTTEFEQPGSFEGAVELAGPVLEKELGPLLQEQIRRFSPDVLIVHSGMIFNVQTDAFLSMLIKIREMYPNLRMALERKSDWLVRDPGHIAADRIRWVRENFEEDPAIESIIHKIF